MKKERNYKQKFHIRFLLDLELIQKERLVDPKDWGLFRDQIKKDLELLDKDWLGNSQETKHPPLSTYGYRKRYLQSIPPHLKELRGWESKKSDFRIVFKVYEEKKEILYYSIGKRIKGFPKHPLDIWSLMKGRTLPEEE